MHFDLKYENAFPAWNAHGHMEFLFAFVIAASSAFRHYLTSYAKKLAVKVRAPKGVRSGDNERGGETDSPTNRLTDFLTGWRTDWLTDCMAA